MALERESYLKEAAFIEGKYVGSFLMGLPLGNLEPTLLKIPNKSLDEEYKNIRVRQLMDKDLPELNKLQNCV